MHTLTIPSQPISGQAVRSAPYFSLQSIANADHEVSQRPRPWDASQNLLSSTQSDVNARAEISAFSPKQQSPFHAFSQTRHSPPPPPSSYVGKDTTASMFASQVKINRSQDDYGFHSMEFGDFLV